MQSFFASDVDFSSSPSFPLEVHKERVPGRWIGASLAAAAVAVSGLLTLYNPPAALSDLHVDPSAVHGRTNRTPKHVSINTAHRQAAARVAASFVEVPPSEADQEVSPDYDL